MSDVFELQSDLQKTPVQHSFRYYGFLSGVVTNAKDDQGLCRIKARIGAMGDNEESEWLIPAFPGSIECIPSKGDPCIVGFLDGDPNRGFWLYHPESTTKQRPSEAMVLGSAAWAVINNLIDQVSSLKSSVNTFIAVYNGHTHTAGTPSTGTPSAAGVTSSADFSAKGMASDGSTIPSKTGSKVVLSGLCKVK